MDDDDNSTKCDALLAAAQFRRNFPQFCAADNGAIICRRRRVLDRRPSVVESRRR